MGTEMVSAVRADNCCGEKFFAENIIESLQATGNCANIKLNCEARD